MKRTVGVGTALAVALALGACANDRVWMRSGATSSDAQIDEMNCAAEAEQSGVSIGIGDDAGPKTDRFSNRYACLRAKGYRLKSLTGEEAAKLKSLGGVEKEVYWNELLAKNGLRPSTENPETPQPLAPPPAKRAPAQ